MPIAGTPFWAEASVWGLEGRQFRPASCCPCGAGEVWAAEPGGPSVGEWRGCGEAARACGGCSSRRRCRAAASCSLCGWARPSCWTRSLARWWVEAVGGADGRLWGARCLKLRTHYSDWARICRCCSCRTGPGSWRPDWQIGTQWAKGWKVALWSRGNDRRFDLKYFARHRTQEQLC